MREPFINEVEALATIAQLTKERDELREALEGLLCHVEAHPDTYDAVDRARTALANLNKTDGE